MCVSTRRDGCQPAAIRARRNAGNKSVVTDWDPLRAIHTGFDLHDLSPIEADNSKYREGRGENAAGWPSVVIARG